MAPSTACSASLLHGAWRPANSGDRSGDETAGDTDVIPGRFLPVGVPEQRGRMVRHDDRNTPEPMHVVPECTERLLRVEERLRRRAAHGENHLRLEELDLAEQVRHARRDLVVLGLAVFGRAAFHDVADEHALARQLDRGEDLGQEFTAGPTNGRPVSSSTRPGPSPTTTRRASAGPSPGTVCARPSHSRHLVQLATSSAIAASERACATGSVAKRSPPGGSKESPGGGRPWAFPGLAPGVRAAGTAEERPDPGREPGVEAGAGPSDRTTGSPPSKRCCSRYSRASARPSLTSALAPPRRGSCLPRRASAGSAARSARRRAAGSSRDSW